jgi:putative oxygen-independent coproporphyrinogen III oxidase
VVRPRHVYIHVPFCARRCSYCDFSIAVRARPPVDEYLAALQAELSLRYPRGEPWDVDTIYFGGGTPSALGPDVARLMDLVRGFVEPAPDAEITLEANPEHVSGATAATWRTAGVNRLSLGAQSFDAHTLRWMHRTHGVDDIPRAIDAARGAGIENVSLDLIFALPENVGRDWSDDLNRALALRPAHLSLYGLTVEPSTPLARWIDRGKSKAPDDGVYAEEFLAAHTVATALGYEHYEVSNFALPGARSRHNSSYWQLVPYAGLGPSAHEFDGTTRRWNASPYVQWRSALRAGADPVDGSETLTPEQRQTERVYLGLRTTDGLDIEPGDEPVIDSWVSENWVERRAGRVVMTASGWLRLDALAADLTYARSRSYF